MKEWANRPESSHDKFISGYPNIPQTSAAYMKCLVMTATSGHKFDFNQNPSTRPVTSKHPSLLRWQTHELIMAATTFIEAPFVILYYLPVITSASQYRKLLADVKIMVNTWKYGHPSFDVQYISSGICLSFPGPLLQMLCLI